MNVQYEKYNVTHAPSLLMHFVHWPICHTEAIHLTPGLTVLILKTVYTALDKLHVVLSQCACLVCENVLHLQTTENNKTGQFKANTFLY